MEYGAGSNLEARPGLKLGQSVSRSVSEARKGSSQEMRETGRERDRQDGGPDIDGACFVTHDNDRSPPAFYQKYHFLSTARMATSCLSDQALGTTGRSAHQVDGVYTMLLGRGDAGCAEDLGKVQDS